MYGNNIIKMFEDYIENPIDYDKLYKDLKKHTLRWMYRSKDHIEFMSSNLIGVHVVKYTIDDENDFFSIFDIDKINLKKDIDSLRDINPAWKVSSNPRYLTIFYTIHSVLTDKVNKDLKKHKDLRTKIIMELNTIFSIQVYTSLMVTYYRYQLDENIANTVFENLPYRFILKKEGSWKRVFDYFSQYVLPKGTHEKKLTRFTTKDAMDVTADMQGKIRSTVIELTRVVHNTIDLHNARESRGSLTLNEEGEEELLDVINSNKVYHNALSDIIYRPTEFVRKDYIGMMKELYPNLYEKELTHTLIYMSENYLKHKKDIDNLIENCLNANIKYLYRSRLYPPYDKNIIDVIKFLRGFWINSKVNDKDNVTFKKDCKAFVRMATGKKTERVIATVTISIAVYLMLMAIDNSRGSK
jgi:hypothetical protein